MKRKAAALEGKAVGVGFHDDHVAAIARLHEFGHPAIQLPSRPAFRAAREPMNRAVHNAIKTAGPLPPDVVLSIGFQ